MFLCAYIVGRERRAHQIYKTNATGGIAIYRLDRGKRGFWISRSTIGRASYRLYYIGSGWIAADYDSFSFFFFPSFFFQFRSGDGAAASVAFFSYNGCIPKLRWAYDLFFFLSVSFFFRNVFRKKINKKDCRNKTKGEKEEKRRKKKTDTVVTLRLPAVENRETVFDINYLSAATSVVLFGA
jgi:hypothetical protein